MKDKPKIYLAHPYGRRRNLSDEELEANVENSNEIARQLIKKGWNPFPALLWHYLHKGWHGSPDEEIYFHLVSAWIEDCDAFYYGGHADGVERERKIAEALHKPVYYSLEDVP